MATGWAQDGAVLEQPALAEQLIVERFKELDGRNYSMQLAQGRKTSFWARLSAGVKPDQKSFDRLN